MRKPAPSPARVQVALLSGQKLQGVLTSQEVQEILKKRGWEGDYPLFTTVNRIVRRQLPVSSITSYREAALLPVAEGEEESSADEAGNGVLG